MTTKIDTDTLRSALSDQKSFNAILNYWIGCGFENINPVHIYFVNKYVPVNWFDSKYIIDLQKEYDHRELLDYPPLLLVIFEHSTPSTFISCTSAVAYTSAKINFTEYEHYDKREGLKIHKGNKEDLFDEKKIEAMTFYVGDPKNKHYDRKLMPPRLVTAYNALSSYKSLVDDFIKVILLKAKVTNIEELNKVKDISKAFGEELKDLHEHKDLVENLLVHFLKLINAIPYDFSEVFIDVFHSFVYCPNMYKYFHKHKYYVNFLNSSVNNKIKVKELMSETR